MSDGFAINIKVLGGPEIRLTGLTGNAPVGFVIRNVLVALQGACPPERLRLIHNGRRLPADRSLRECGIERETDIHAVIVPEGAEGGGDRGVAPAPDGEAPANGPAAPPGRAAPSPPPRPSSGGGSRAPLGHAPAPAPGHPLTAHVLQIRRGPHEGARAAPPPPPSLSAAWDAEAWEAGGRALRYLEELQEQLPGLLRLARGLAEDAAEGSDPSARTHRLVEASRLAERFERAVVPAGDVLARLQRMAHDGNIARRADPAWRSEGGAALASAAAAAGLASASPAAATAALASAPSEPAAAVHASVPPEPAPELVPEPVPAPAPVSLPSPDLGLRVGPAPAPAPAPTALVPAPAPAPRTAPAGLGAGGGLRPRPARRATPAAAGSEDAPGPSSDGVQVPARQDPLASLMRGAMESPAFQRAAQPPSLRQAAGGGEGRAGVPDLGALMQAVGPLVGELLGGGGASGAGADRGAQPDFGALLGGLLGGGGARPSAAGRGGGAAQPDFGALLGGLLGGGAGSGTRPASGARRPAAAPSPRPASPPAPTEQGDGRAEAPCSFPSAALEEIPEPQRTRWRETLAADEVLMQRQAREGRVVGAAAGADATGPPDAADPGTTAYPLPGSYTDLIPPPSRGLLE